ncbi:MAG: M48 family metallopeptidase [Actinomycetota bacterium]|nr:M48 family metallopeptidase [Actinomycetota bacterium]
MNLATEGVVWVQGIAVPVERTGADRAVARISRNPGHLVVGGRRKQDALAAIDRWYRREARKRIEPVVSVEADRLGLHPEKISVRAQRTRWGSCSTSGTLSFNWRLVLGEPEALRYVVIHELVHIEHHNHSRRFWNALSEAMPEWKTWAAWLRANERALLTYRPKI